MSQQPRPDTFSSRRWPTPRQLIHFSTDRVSSERGIAVIMLLVSLWAILDYTNIQGD